MCRLWFMEKVSLLERVTAVEGDYVSWKERVSSHQLKGNGKREELQKRATRGAVTSS